MRFEVPFEPHLAPFAAPSMKVEHKDLLFLCESKGTPEVSYLFVGFWVKTGSFQIYFVEDHTQKVLVVEMHFVV